MEINNSAGLSIGTNGTITISTGNLLLTNGIITTTSTNKLSITNTSAACVVPSGGSATSFVNGPLAKIINPNTSFTFPIGQDTTWGHQVILTDSALAGNWTVQYFSPNPTYTSMTLPLQAVNDLEYWGVKSTVARSANISLGWSPTSDLTALMTLNGLTDMRVAQYSGSSWLQLPSTASGGLSTGNVVTNYTVSIGTTQTNFTTASVTSTAPKATLSPSGPVCGTAGIPVKFTTYSPINLYYMLSYTINGSPYSIKVTSLPDTLPTPIAGTYQLTGFTYNDGTLAGVVDPTTVTDYSMPKTANAGNDTSLCGKSGVTLVGNNPAPNTGLWNIVSGSGGIVLSPTQYNSVFNGQLGNSYTLQWTISSGGGCQSSDQVVVAFPVAPQQPSAFTAAPTPVCQGANNVTYTVPAMSAVTYNWSYTGGTGVTIVGSSNSVKLNFSSSATSGTLNVTATNSCGTSSPRSTSITVNPLPAITAMTSTTCSAVGFTVTPVNGTNGIVPAGTTYSWSAPAVTGGLTGGAAGVNAANISGTLTNPTNSAQTATYTITPKSSGCTGSTFTVTVTVNPAPVISAITSTVCSGVGFTATPVNVTNGIVPAGTTYSWAAPAVTGGLTGGAAGVNAANISGTLTNPTSSAQTATYTVTPTSGSCTGSTFTVTVTVNPLPAITAMTSTTCSAVGFTVTPVNITNGTVPAGTTYSWAAPVVTGGLTGGSAGVNAANISGTLTNPTNSPQTATYTVTPTSSGCPGSTFTVTITVNPATSITTDPVNSTIFAGQNTSFTIAATGTGSLSYSWEVSTNSGVSWNPVSGGVYSGANTVTLTITSATLSMNKYWYHCVVTSGCGTATSNYGILTVNPTATASISGSTTICSGQSATLSVALTGTANWSITYTDGVTPVTVNNINASPYTFVVSPATTTTYTITNISDVNGPGTIVVAGATVTVNLTPNTGPVYRKPNL